MMQLRGEQSNRKQKATSYSNMNCLLLFVAGTGSNHFKKLKQQKATQATMSNFSATKSNFRQQKIEFRATNFVAGDKKQHNQATKATSNKKLSPLIFNSFSPFSSKSPFLHFVVGERLTVSLRSVSTYMYVFCMCFMEFKDMGRLDTTGQVELTEPTVGLYFSR